MFNFCLTLLTLINLCTDFVIVCCFAWFLLFKSIQLCFNLLEYVKLCLTLFNSRSYAQILCLLKIKIGKPARSVSFRERVIRFLFTLDDMRNLSGPLQHNLLRSNLCKVQMLAQIYTCNLRTLQEEVSFIFSKVKNRTLQSDFKWCWGFCPRPQCPRGRLITSS